MKHNPVGRLVAARVFGLSLCAFLSLGITAFAMASGTTPNANPSVTSTPSANNSTPSPGASLTPSGSSADASPSASATSTASASVTKTTPSATAEASPAPALRLAAAAVEPALPTGAGKPVTITDANGNSYTFQLTEVSDGTGHGTKDQCFVNSDTGYTPGDNSPTDGVVCVRDRVTYQVDWKVSIADLTNASVNLRFLKGGGGTYSAGWFELDSGGATGGTSLGFIGTMGPGSDRLTMKFTRTGALSGFWTFTIHLLDRFTASLFDPYLLVNGTATVGDQTASFIADKQVKVIGRLRDDEINQTVLQGLLVNIDGKSYLPIDVRTPHYSGSVRGVNPPIYPNYNNGKGWGGYDGSTYWPDILLATRTRAAVDALTPLAFTLDGAPAGTLVAVNQWDPKTNQVVPGTPTSATMSGTTASVEASIFDSVRFLVPWDELQDGTNHLTSRTDMTGPLLDKAGNQINNGAPDPGVGLECTTTTQDAIPGSRAGAGGTYPTFTGAVGMPNNNCAAITLVKGGGRGTYQKVDRVTYTKLPDTQGIPINNSLVGDTPEYNSSRSSFEASITIGVPTGPSHNLASCVVWRPDEMRTTGRFLVDGKPIQEAFPGVKILYTTKDLTPEGNGGAPLDCGSPSDATTWAPTTLTPGNSVADWAQYSGVMFIFPGDNTLVSDIVVTMSMASEIATKYPDLINEVHNWQGYSTDTTVNQPSWGASMSAVTVVKTYVEANNNYTDTTNPNTPMPDSTSLPIGQVTHTTPISGGWNSQVNIVGYVPSEGIRVTEKIYLDKCMLNSSVTTTNKSIDSYRIVGSPNPDGDCGVSSDYYVEVNWLVKDVPTKREPPIMVTWTTPATSAPGDKYSIHPTFENPTPNAFSFKAYPQDRTYTVAPSSVIGSTKAAADPLVPIESSFSNTVGWFNYSKLSAGKVQFIDVFPFNGDNRGTKFSGTVTLSNVAYVKSGDSDEASSYEYTKAAPASVKSDPADPSNQTGGATTWCSALSGGDCPANLGEVTAMRFTTDDLAAGLSQFYQLTFTTSGNKADDVYVNSLSVRPPFQAPSPVTTKAYASIITVTKKGVNCDAGVATCDLPGAEFALYRTDPTGSDATPIPDGIAADQPGGATFTATNLVPGKDYWLVETKAPAGRELLATPIKFTVAVGQPSAITLADAGTVAALDPKNPAHLIITDPSTGSLPKVGGYGVRVGLTGALGLVIVGGAGYLAVRRRCHSS